MKKSIRVIAMTTVLSMLAGNLNTAVAQTWTQRSLSEVKQTLAENVDGIYIIQWGDTLSTIAEATGYTLEQLTTVNQIADADLIAAGAVLYFNEANNTVTYVDTDSDITETYEIEEEVAEPVYVVEETPEWVAASEEVTEAPVTEAVIEVPVTEEVTEVPVTEAVIEVPVTEEVTEAPVTEAVIEVPVTEEVTEAPVTEEVTEAPVTEEVTEAPVTEEVTEAPVTEEVTEAPVTEEVTEAPVTEEVTEAPVTEAPATNNGQYNEYGGIISEAKEIIAMRESGGAYEIWNPTETYYGRYQLHYTYLEGDFSRENQERVADAYVINRYGSWEAALAFWNQNNWY